MPRPMIAIQKYDSSATDDGKNATHHSMLNYEFVSTRASYINTEVPVMSYIGYYVVSLLYNAFLLALYVVAVFSHHHDCLTKSGTNITT